MKKLLQLSALFLVSVCFGQTPIYEFNFNGQSTSSNDGSSFFYDSNFAAGFATPTALDVRIFNRYTASLPNLPIGNAPRTVSVRIYFPQGSLNSDNYVFNYGTEVPDQSYGYTQNGTATATHYFWGDSDLFNINNPMNSETWYNMTFVFDGVTASVYRNGTLVTSAFRNLNTVGTNFNLANGNLIALIDDLRIYNIALTQTQISSLNNALSNQDFNTNNLKFLMSPNPANNILNINMEKELSSIEIYSIQGQKVFSGNDKAIDITNLSSGMYMVRVQDIDGSIATQKLIVE